MAETTLPPEAVRAAAERTGRPRLGDRIPPSGTRDPDEILDLFLGWTADAGFQLYPAQEEALLELMAGRHVILNTPTGSGKSMVALGLHFKALCEGRVSYYTSPIKALASEKFFSLCEDFGASHVGMLTGDASINGRALVRCCTAEVLMNMALREGERLDAPYVVMDEFHYFSDPDRGVAWQVPLITLPRTTFLLMSATLGNTAPIAEPLEEFTGRKVATVATSERPVPLDFEYRETPLHETVEELVEKSKAPIYIVSFTQRECHELAQALTSMTVASKEVRQKIRREVKDFPFDTPYGKDIKRFLGFGIGVHHAGLLPKYRLLVEQLSQQGLLKVICGTDTLGVGVNIPIRTVLFSRLCKFDGQKTGILTVRDFKQIGGRAGRKGFDDAGSVVCQAPEHVIENLRLEQKWAQGGKKKGVKKQPPTRGYVHWDADTFQRLIEKPPETLESRFRLNHAMILELLQQDAEADDPNLDNFSGLRRLIARSHESDASREHLITQAAQLVWSLYRAGLIRMERDTSSTYLWVTVDPDLQLDFSLFHALSLYLVDTLPLLDAQSEDYALDVLSLVEAVLENPRALLYKQEDKIKGELIAQWKAEGVEYEERMERLQEVTYPKPNAEFIYETFDRFRGQQPWLAGENIHPKGIGRELFEGYWSFSDYVRHLGLQRSEGVLLRYVSQLYKTLNQNVPEGAKTPELYDIEGFFRAMIENTDTSLLEEWESLLHPEWHWEGAEEQEKDRATQRFEEMLANPRAFNARVRAEMAQMTRALAARDYEEAARWVRHSPSSDGSGAEPWTAERLEEALAPFYEEYEEIVWGPDARQAHLTRVESTGPRTWEVTHVLLDPWNENLWHLAGTVDLTSGQLPEGPMVQLERVGT